MGALQSVPVEMRDGVLINTHIIDNGHQDWLIIVHGVCEYLERYDEIASRYQHRYNIFRFDLRGHGRSEGKKHTIEHFDDFSKDLEELVKFLKRKYQMDNFVLFAHSLGGLICAQALQKHALTFVRMKAIFLSSPCIAPANILVSAAKILPQILSFKNWQENVSLTGFVRENLLSHATKTNPIYQDLHLNNLKMSLRLMLAIATYSKRVFSKPLRVNVPVYAVIGSEDAIVNVKAFTSYFENIEFKANVWVIDGAYHELMHEAPIYKDTYFRILDKVLD